MDDRDCTVIPPDPLLRSPVYLVAELGKLIRRFSAERLTGEDGVRLPHVMVLACVHVEGPMSQREVGDRLRMDAGDVVGVVDALERLGYAERRRDPRDRRRWSVAATGAGVTFLAARREQAMLLYRQIFEPLGPEELEVFQGLVLKVLAHHDPRFADTVPGLGSEV
ncbi:MarR family winged helix-turn-helix transcriptional regulator [Spirillospora sp. CA-294931]|uniref:MarR family winged helix-turn-helix transcriptional regulator n=1 Tax=Spirillospora sp. CA-294931 TaxID=3240042 RepID=UPI003D90689B